LKLTETPLVLKQLEELEKIENGLEDYKHGSEDEDSLDNKS